MPIKMSLIRIEVLNGNGFSLQRAMRSVLHGLETRI